MKKGGFWIVKTIKIIRENNNEKNVIEDRSSPLDMNFNYIIP